MKFVSPLNEATSKALWTIVRGTTLPQHRERAHAVLLSDQRYKLDDLARIFNRDRDTVSTWLTNWEEYAFDGLNDEERSGRPRKTTAKEDRHILRTVEKHPQQVRVAQAELQKKRV
jgi:transposase